MMELHAPGCYSFWGPSPYQFAKLKEITHVSLPKELSIFEGWFWICHTLNYSNWGVGGGIKTKQFLIYNIAIFPSKSTKHGLKWKLTSLPICRMFDHFSMLNGLVGRGRRSSLVWLLAFGTTIFEISSFFIYIGNMYIKWKLKTHCKYLQPECNCSSVNSCDTYNF